LSAPGAPGALSSAPRATEALGRALAARHALSTRTRPADDARGIADDDRVGGHVANDDRSRPDHREAPDPNGSDEDRRGPKGGTLFDQGLVPVGTSSVRGARTAHVGEHRARTDEHVGPQNDPVPNARVTLNSCSGPDDRARSDVAERPDDDVLREMSAIGDHAGRMNAWRGSLADSASHRPQYATLAPPRRDDYPRAAAIMPLTYKQAGVDVDAGDELVERIKPLAAATRTAEVLAGVGGFAGLCRVPSEVEDPVLVSGTDGVGTKLKVAFLTGVHDTIGIDLVGMCVNDVLTSGARPLFFLDYFATSKLDVGVAERVVAGVAAGCKESGCALLGGETAELPGMYAPGEYDLAGFAVGVVARRRIVDGSRVSAGDVALAMASSGLHSNGYSLARAVVFETMKLSPDDRVRELGGRTLGEVLLTPTRLYARHVRAMLDRTDIDVRAMCHVTGSGVPGNLPRVLPEGLGVRFERPWARAPIFDFIQRGGSIDDHEMRRTFNVGIGFVFVVPETDALRATETLQALGESPIARGQVIRVPADRPFEERVEWPL
jgi:phosphoribosylformylglycinamidine cyclo-ligase